MDEQVKKIEEEIEELEKASEEYNNMIEEEPIEEKTEVKEESSDTPSPNIEENDLTKEEEKEEPTIENTAEENKEQIDNLNKGKKPFNKNIIIIALIVIIVLMAVYLLYSKKTNDKKMEQLANSQVIKEKRDLAVNNKEQTREEIIKEKRKKEIEDSRITDEYKKWEKKSDKEKKEIEVIPRKEVVPIEEIDEIKDEIDYNDKDTIPEKFNLKDKIKLIVENQGWYGLCWDFASLNTLETNIALNHNKDFDFSEIHVDYITSDLMFGSRQIHDGGNFGYFEDYFKYAGTVLEEELPYSKDYSKEEYSKFTEMIPTAYATETVDYPSIELIDKEDKDYDEKVEEYRNIIKTHIMKEGSLYAAISSDCLGDSSCFMPGDNSDSYVDHAISIVGWDDKYPKEKLKSNSGVTPKKDGAYIALNSWGTNWGENGYFYISYEDKFVETNLSGVVSSSFDKDGYIDLSSISNDYLQSEIRKQVGNQIIRQEGKEYISKLLLRNVDIPSDLSNKNITDDDLELINYFDLWDLNLSNNNITDISKLNIEDLFELDLSNNKITTIKHKEIGEGPYTINLSGNPISDVSELKNYKNLFSLELNNIPTLDTSTIPTHITSLSIQNSNITSFPKFDDDISLDASNSKNIDLSKLPKTINSLNLENCNIDSLDKLAVEDVRHINIAKNNISDISKLKEYKLLTLDLSGNKIKDFSQLNDINTYSGSIEDSENEDDEYYYGNMYISELLLNDMNIDDISILNKIDFDIVYLKNNNISDLSKYDGKQTYLNLSGNKGINDISSLYNVSSIILEGCQIKDLKINAEKEMKTVSLNLNDNDITDLSFVEQLPKLVDLSLNKNKNIKGPIKSKSLELLELIDCNIKDLNGFIDAPKISMLNLGDNKELVINKTVDLFLTKDDFLTLRFNNVETNYEDMLEINEKIKNLYMYVYDFNLVINTSNKELLLNDYSILKEGLLYAPKYGKLENCEIDSEKIVIQDINKEAVIEYPSYFKTEENQKSYINYQKLIIRYKEQ